MKRIFSFLITVIVCLSLSSCAGVNVRRGDELSSSSPSLPPVSTPEQLQGTPFAAVMEKIYEKPFMQITEDDYDRMKGFYIDKNEIYYALDDTALQQEKITAAFAAKHVYEIPNSDSFVRFVWTKSHIMVNEIAGLRDNLPLFVKELDHLKNLEFCSVSNTGIENLEFAQYCTNLWFLDFSACAVSDLTPLASCSQLRVLSGMTNHITGIGPLASLAELRAVDLQYNSIDTLTPLSGLKGLEDVILTGNRIGDFTPLSGLPGLKVLYLSKNQISDPAPAAGFPSSLTALYLSENNIRSVAGLGTDSASELRKGLQVLDLSKNKITDLSSLASFSALQEMNLSSNQITNGDAALKSPALQSLMLADNQIADFAHAAEISVSLQSLDLSGNQIRDITGLRRSSSGETSLSYLNLSHNQLSNISSLAVFNKLATLRMAYNEISELSPLSGMHLSEVDLSYNPLKSIAPLHIQKGKNGTILGYLSIKLQGTPFANSSYEFSD